MQAGSGVATLSKKFAMRRYEDVSGLFPAGDGVAKPVPERMFFPPGKEGTAAHEQVVAEHVDKEMGGGIKQVCAAPCLVQRAARDRVLRVRVAEAAHAQAVEQRGPLQRLARAQRLLAHRPLEGG